MTFEKRSLRLPLSCGLTPSTCEPFFLDSCAWPARSAALYTVARRKRRWSCPAGVLSI